MWGDEHRIIDRNGEIRTVLARGLPVHNESGKIISWVGINLDITGRKKMEEELRQAHDHLELLVQERTTELQKANCDLRQYSAKLEVLNRELQDFAHIASHDLQEPLRKIVAFGDRLKAKCEAALSDEGCDYLERMQNAAKRMQTLIQNLLDLSSVATRVKPFRTTDLTKIIEEVTSDLEPRIEETGATVDIDNLAAIPVDPSQMRQLFQNLIGNSLKFTREEKPLIRIYGRYAEGDSQYQVFVEDNGIGFDEIYLDRIFSPFQRLHGRSAFEGTGIGLAICRKIMDRHGGSITARSERGVGSTFILTFP
jgi:light-regulated signal transduction histidine kinase (bacteriophytochrome)